VQSFCPVRELSPGERPRDRVVNANAAGTGSVEASDSGPIGPDEAPATDLVAPARVKATALGGRFWGDELLPRIEDTGFDPLAVGGDLERRCAPSSSTSRGRSANGRRSFAAPAAGAPGCSARYWAAWCSGAGSTGAASTARRGIVDERPGARADGREELGARVPNRNVRVVRESTAAEPLSRGPSPLRAPHRRASPKPDLTSLN
jgi:hypothetical protein